MRRAASIAAALVFALSAAVQWNDPDPLPWLLLYGLASGVCVLRGGYHVPGWLGFLLAAVAALWASTLLPGVIATAALTGTEEERELAGLLLVAVACGALARGGDR